MSPQIIIAGLFGCGITIMANQGRIF